MDKIDTKKDNQSSLVVIDRENSIDTQSEWKIVGEMCRGEFGKVLAAKHALSTNQHFMALKVVTVGSKDEKYIQNEAKVFTKLHGSTWSQSDTNVYWP